MHRRLLIFSCFLPFILQAQYKFSGNLSTSGIMRNQGENPFWMYANKNGRITSNTGFLNLGQVALTNELGEYDHFNAGAAIIARDGSGANFYIDQLYAQYRYKKISLQVGAWHRAIKMNDLSGVGGDIIWSGNARALPGAVLSLTDGVKLTSKLSFKAQLGHYFLNEDRFVKNAQVHYKNIHFDFDLNPLDRLSFAVDHYAQFGGVSRAYGPQPNSFSDYLKIFTGWSGGREARPTDQANALGNHLGSYTFSYSMVRYFFDLKLYHQNIFEDSSGMELRNFPDGVWGLYIEPKGTALIKAFLYEYVQTVSQGGRFVPPPNGNFRGGDNYFGNGIYQSGWTYKNNIIGLPFIIPAENGRGIKINRSYVHHLGLLGAFDKLNYKIKGSYVKNLGTYTQPLQEEEEAIYSYIGLTYPLFSGHINAELAIDLSNRESTNMGLSLGYQISF